MVISEKILSSGKSSKIRNIGSISNELAFFFLPYNILGKTQEGNSTRTSYQKLPKTMTILSLIEPIKFNPLS